MRTILLVLSLLLLPFPVFAQTSISPIGTFPSSVKVYEKYEAKFNLGTSASIPFYEYTTSPPPGITSGVGVNVYALITLPNATTVRHPLFQMTDITRSGSVYEETNTSYWTLRYSPLVTGNYSYRLEIQDSQGTRNSPNYTFSATTPSKPGFVQVSKNDSRYFEFSNGSIFWPLGTADDFSNDFSQLSGSGINMARPWIGPLGIYSTNWARWKSSAELHGNEGIKTSFSFTEHAPGSDLSYQLFYPEGYRTWIGTWMDDQFGPRFKNGRLYQATMKYKTQNIAGSGGLSVKISDYAPWGDPTMNQFLTNMNNGRTLTFSNMNQLKNSNGWVTATGTLTSNQDTTNLFVYLDNVTAGQAYVDSLSIKECLNNNCTTLGGEIVRNPKADNHTYVEQRPAAYLDDLLSQAEANNVFFKMVVHDKNDWIQSHLNDAGQFVDESQGNGYNPPYNTKARFLLRQWYRYFAARWGYSTALHTYEMQNEGDPNDTHHWQAAQDFAKYLDDQDAHPHLATTSFWCCWMPAFWGNKTLYPDIDYADLHQYTVHNEPINGTTYRGDMAAFNYEAAKAMSSSNVGMPLWRAETGIAQPGTFSEDTSTYLNTTNAGVWYHNLIWPQLSPYVLYDPGYWFSQHKAKINMLAHTKPFYDFIKTLDLNQGGYVDAAVSNAPTQLRAWGQKNLSKNKAVIWFQNSRHTWENVRDNVNMNPITTTVSLNMNSNTAYTLEWWNTYTGTKTTQTATSNGSGVISLNINNLSDDIALKITGPGGTSPTITMNPTPTAIPGDLNGDTHVTFADIMLFVKTFAGIFSYNNIVRNFGR